MTQAILLKTINDLVIPGKGILAADESTGTCAKRFDSIGVASTEENRRAYREMLFTAEGLENYISGVILYEETLSQKTKDGIPFAELLAGKGIVPGIKVDKGTQILPGSQKETFTQGLDGLTERLQQYKKLGARFAKWRGVLALDEEHPSRLAMKTNAEGLALYAALCQQEGIVPIVEPELLMDGAHTLERCFTATEKTLRTVFQALARHKVFLEGIILKPSMVISGKLCPKQADVKTVAEATLTVLRRTVPAAVPSINFLSGGQSDQLAVEHLKAMNQSDLIAPWYVSFSYGRALQAPALKAWGGQESQVKVAQEALLERAKANSQACQAK